MAKKLILVALVSIAGGVLAKDGAFKAAEAAPGEELTPEKLTALGLDDAAVEALEAKGHVERVPVRTAEDTDGTADADLAAANKRADEAEAKVKELTEANEALTKKVSELEAAAKPKTSGAQA